MSERIMVLLSAEKSMITGLLFDDVQLKDIQIEVTTPILDKDLFIHLNYALWDLF